MEKKKLRFIFYIVFVCLILSSLVMIFVPYVNFNGTQFQKSAGIFLGVIFWAGLIIGWILYGFMYGNLKSKGAFKKKRRPGIFCFFSNRQAILADMICVITLMINIIILFIHVPWTWMEAAAAAAFMFLLSFHSHYIFNGATYQQFFSGRKEIIEK